MKIEYKAIDDDDNIYRGIETVNDIEDLCHKLTNRDLMPIAIRMLGTNSITAFSRVKHLKNLKKKLEHKIDQEIDIDNIQTPTRLPERRNKVDFIYILYFIGIAILAIGYYMGF